MNYNMNPIVKVMDKAINDLQKIKKDKVIKVTAHKCIVNKNQYIIVVKSATLNGYYHVIIDNASQDNEYYHMPKDQLAMEYRIFITSR